MLIISICLAAFSIGMSFIVNEKNAKHLLSGYNSLSETERAQFDIKNYLRFFRKWMFALSLILIGTSLGFHFIADKTESIWPFGLYIAGFGAFILASKKFGKTDQKVIYNLGASLLFLIAGLMIFFGMYSLEKENALEIHADHLKISGLYGVSIPFNQIKSWSLSNELPPIKHKRHGVAVHPTYKGIFNTKSGEKVRLMINQNESPYLYFELKSGEKIWYGFNSVNQIELAEKLKIQLPANTQP